MYCRLKSLFSYNLHTEICNLILIQQLHQAHRPNAMTYITQAVYTGWMAYTTCIVTIGLVLALAEENSEAEFKKSHWLINSISVSNWRLAFNNMFPIQARDCSVNADDEAIIQCDWHSEVSVSDTEWVWLTATRCDDDYSMTLSPSPLG